MPGLIDVHWHAMLVRPNPVEALASDIGYLNFLAGAEATATLMRGFTTIRDMGGPVFGRVIPLPTPRRDGFRRIAGERPRQRLADRDSDV